ncbi:MAG TPA: DUF899 domain-containing protein [Streptosporangiaceae bacterium]|nr:DUF899 domain-containing protein [Streptosporangiaceae bacterium]
MSLPDVVSREQWLEARRRLLAQEKEMTRRHDELNASRRRLPMVRVDAEYVFDGPGGKVTLAQLFGDKRQLVVQHVMFGPDWDQPCPGCSAALDELSPGVLEHVASRDTAFALISRAPYEKIAAKAKERGWTAAPWYSSHGSDFNYDYQVSLDAESGQSDYNYRPEPGLLGGDRSAEMPGYSCFLRDGDEVFHTYSAFARGTEYVGNAYTFLDMTALGRQEDWEEPKGRSAATRGGDPTFTS